MLTMKNLEEIFARFLNCVNVLEQALNVSFGEALTETFDNLETGKIKVELGAPDEATVEKLSKLYADLNYEKIPPKVKSQVFNYLTLKAINDDGRDVNQMPTPSVIATVFALLMQKLLPRKKLNLVDPAIGTGSLLYSVVNQLKAENHSQNPYQLYGIDNDESMLDFADIAAHLNNLKINLYCQDALTPWMVQAGAVISDLPIGFYPVDANAKHFATKASKGHSLAHLLYIEQIVKNLKEAGYAFLLVPQEILGGRTGADFMPWLSDKVYIRAIVELPDNLFKNKFNEKTILVFQNHGGRAQSGEVLLTKLESLQTAASLVKFNVKLDEWFNRMRK